MTKISKKTWIIFIVLSFLSIAVWEKFTAPQLSFIDLSVGRTKALSLASQYLTKEIGLSPKELGSYHRAITFVSMDGSDHYLQRAMGFKKELEFLKKYDYELFFWSVRYFKENQKEEYHVSLSAATGQVTGYNHPIESNAFRPEQTEEQARAKVSAFFKKNFNFDTNLYAPHANNAQKYEKRTDYFFSWENSDSKIAWSSDPKAGSSILHSGATVSGDEILSFYKNGMDIPDQYSRFMDWKQNLGRNLSIFFRLLFYVILTTSIFYVIINRNSLVMYSVKNFSIALTATIFLLYLASYFNDFQSVLFRYPTTAPMSSFLWRNITATVMNTFIVVLSILMPCLAGESLHQENFPNKKQGTFLHYLRSTFLSRNVTAAILIGYFSAVIMIGIQTTLFEIGQRYWGVWVQYTWMAQLSENYLPCLAALILGATAAFSEEIYYRLFGINLAKKYFKNTFLACLIASIIWGFGHSGYFVFPMWFRVFEITCMGLFLSFIYLRFGIIAVITAHYLFDVFWESSAFLLGKSPASEFYGSLAILTLPLLLAAIAFVANKKVGERPLRWKLNVHQLFNLAILKEYIQRHNLLAQKPTQELKKEIASHGWDLAVVEMAIEDVMSEKVPKPPQTYT